MYTILPVYSNLSSASESKSCASSPPQCMGSRMTLEDPCKHLSNGERLAHLSLWANNFSIRPSIRFFSSGLALKIHSRGSKSQASMLEHTDLTSIMVASQRLNGGNYHRVLMIVHGLKYSIVILKFISHWLPIIPTFLFLIRNWFHHLCLYLCYVTFLYTILYLT